MPESYGKRQRSAQRARKLAEREERRLAKKQHRADREAGVVPEGEVSDESPEGEPGSEDQDVAEDRAESEDDA
jgi:hypothetical protein